MPSSLPPKILSIDELHSFFKFGGAYPRLNFRLDAFAHSEAAPYYEDGFEISVIDYAKVNGEFEHLPALEKFLESYVPPAYEANKIRVEIKCEIYLCRCHTPCGGCYIRVPGPAQYTCVNCIKSKKCTVEVIVDFEWDMPWD